MILIAVTIGLSLAAELVLVAQTWLRKVRIFLAVIMVLLLSFGAGELLIARPNVFSGLIFLGGAYRIFNVLRLVKARMHERYLMTVTRRTSLALISFQIIVALLWLGWQALPPDLTGRAWRGWLLGLACVQLVVALGVLCSILKSLVKTRPVTELNNFTKRDLPSLSVCVPARNETEDLQACLASLLSSDYPKLEIIVYDDCSQEKQTPEIIRGFAQGGVRFIAGSPPPDDWLAKNWAYENLLQQASGDLILFCGVDIRFRDDSIRKLVASLLSTKKSMLSLVPERHDSRRVSLIQPMRYFWEFAPPRRLFNRPPVLSSCWLVQAKLLKSIGEFKAVKREIIPERFVAKSAMAVDDGYVFKRSGKFYGVSSHKSVSDQRATAIRTRYPLAKRQPQAVALVGLLEFVFLVAPLGLAIGGWWTGDNLIPVLAAAASISLITGYDSLVAAVEPRAVLSSLISFPFAVLTDIGLMNYSMAAYELSTVQWKSRNVCLPVMHVTPSFPIARRESPASLARKV